MESDNEGSEAQEDSKEGEKKQTEENAQKKGRENKDDRDPEVSRELSIILADMQASKVLRNYSGEVREPLKLIDGDAEEQLESRISIDDQYFSRVSFVVMLTVCGV